MLTTAIGQALAGSAILNFILIAMLILHAQREKKMRERAEMMISCLDSIAFLLLNDRYGRWRVQVGRAYADLRKDKSTRQLSPMALYLKTIAAGVAKELKGPGRAF